MPDNASAKTILFVYGTLKRGLKNHHLIADQVFLGEAVTEPQYRVFDLGPHPGLVEDTAHGLAVKGELWAVTPDCLAKLDEFEIATDLFVRKRIAVAGRPGAVEAYFWVGAVPTAKPSASHWPDE